MNDSRDYLKINKNNVAQFVINRFEERKCNKSCKSISDLCYGERLSPGGELRKSRALAGILKTWTLIVDAVNCDWGKIPHIQWKALK